jgi:superfamily II DNA or RNA helicase
VAAALSLFDDRPVAPSRHTLRPYQEDAISAILRARDEGLGRVLMTLPTGCGKTLTFTELIDRARLSRPALVLAHRDELIRQAADRVQAQLPHLRVAVEKAGEVAPRSANVVVASVQSIGGSGNRRLGWLEADGPELIICDECHHASAISYVSAFERFGAFDGRSFLLGVTATPHRMDAKRLEKVFQAEVYRYGLRDALKDGWLCPIRCFRVTTDIDLSTVKTNNGDFEAGALSRAINNAARTQSAIQHWREVAGDRKTLVFCVDVQHSHDAAEAWREAGYTAAAIDGTMHIDERRAVLARFHAGETQVLANCFDAETEILTDRGWQGIDGIRPSDVTATLNLKTGGIEWQPISRVVRRWRQPGERMVHIRNQTLDIRVTEGHRMVVRAPGARGWKVVEAGALPDRKGPYQIPLAGIGNFPGVALSDVELEFLGLFATDGSLNRKRASLEIAQKPGWRCDEIERILTGCGFDWKVSVRLGATPSGEIREYRIYLVPKGSIGGQLARRGWGRLNVWLSKSLSPLLANCTAGQFRHLVYGLWLGDGFKTYRNSRPKASPRICGVDRTLFDQVQEWAALRGHATTLSWQSNENTGMRCNGPVGVMGIRPRAEVCTNNHTVPTSGGNPARFEDGWQHEEVWCVTNQNGTVITRRNGRVTITGQCAILTEGFDEPSVAAVVMLRPTKSQSLYTQMTGRGTRLAPGKKDLCLIDVVDNCQRHTLVQAPALLGLPPTVDFEGQSLLDGAELLEKKGAARIVAEKPDVSLSTLQTRLEEVNVFATSLELPAEIAAATKLAWTATPDGYFLDCREKRTARLTRDMLGRVLLTLSSGAERNAQIHLPADMGQAIAQADARILSLWLDCGAMVRADAGWRRGSVTDKQRALLERKRVPAEVIEGLTKGDASRLISQLLSGKR